MTQKHLDECRSRCEVMEAVAVGDPKRALTESDSESQESDDWTEFTYGDKRWSFDSDHLAFWDEELDGFHFLAYHWLDEPSIESMTAFIQRKGY